MEIYLFNKALTHLKYPFFILLKLNGQHFTQNLNKKKVKKTLICLEFLYRKKWFFLCNRYKMFKKFGMRL